MTYKKIVKNITSVNFFPEDLSNFDILKTKFKVWVEYFNNNTETNFEIDGPRLESESIYLNEEPIIDDKEILKKTNKYFYRVKKTGHPLMLKNLNPPPTVISLISETFANSYLPNACSEEMSGNLLLAEQVVVKIIRDLFSLNDKYTGLFTFGGTATIMYSLLISVKKIMTKNSSVSINDIVIIASVAAHEALQKSMYWQNLNKNNLIQLPVNHDLTTNYSELEQKIYELDKKGKKVAMVYCAFGTTSNFATDNISDVDKSLSKIQKTIGYKPHLHIDSVAGWIYSVFNDYDIKKNQLKIEKKVLDKIKDAVVKMNGFKNADSFGVDFHKTGFTSYVSSLIMFRTNSLKYLYSEEGQVPHLYNNDLYNPGKFTLETSRSAAKIFATLFSLKSLGKNGLRSLWATALFNGIRLEEELLKHKNTGITIANKIRYGADVLLLTLPHGKSSLDSDFLISDNYAKYSHSFYRYIENQPKEKLNVSIGYTRSATIINGNQQVPGLRLYSLSPHLHYQQVLFVVDFIIKNKSKFDLAND